MGEFGTETLRQVEDEALERNPEGWLVKMLADYLDESA